MLVSDIIGIFKSINLETDGSLGQKVPSFPDLSCGSSPPWDPVYCGGDDEIIFVYLIAETQAPELAGVKKGWEQSSVSRLLMITMVTMSELDLLMDSPLDHSAPVKTSPRLLVSDQEMDQ